MWWRFQGDILWKLEFFYHTTGFRFAPGPNLNLNLCTRCSRFRFKVLKFLGLNLRFRSGVQKILPESALNQTMATMCSSSIITSLECNVELVLCSDFSANFDPVKCDAADGSFQHVTVSEYAYLSRAEEPSCIILVLLDS